MVGNDGSRANVREKTLASISLDATPSPAEDGEIVQSIALAALDPNPYQRRSVGIHPNDDGLIDLSTDIALHGIHQPLIVRRHPEQPGRYQIAAGHRRAAAAELANVSRVPCIVRELADDAMLDVVFAENYHRADTH